MSASHALQIALIAALKADPSVVAALGEQIYDNAPDEVPYPRLTLGPAQELDDSADCIDGAECFQQVDIWTAEGGAQIDAKRICGLVKKAVHGADLDLDDPYGLSLIEVTNIRYQGDPDDKVAHGIMTIRALVEAI